MPESFVKLSSDERELLISIFSYAISIGDMTAPLLHVKAGEVDTETYDKVMSIGHEVMRSQGPLFDKLLKINPGDFSGWPCDVVAALKRVGNVVRCSRTEVVSVGDLGLHFARSDIREAAVAGWQAVVRDRHNDVLRWSIPDAPDADSAPGAVASDASDHLAAGGPPTRGAKRTAGNSKISPECRTLDVASGALPAMGTTKELEETLRKSDPDTSVLLHGETGVGKEYFARYAHQHSTRKPHPFLAVNCASLSKERVDSELFGHVKGSFTDARADRRGHVRDAEKGTLFLDELDKLPPESFGNLLRFLQDKEIRPLGGKAQHVDVRIIAASNRPDLLSTEVRQRFDKVLGIPPLRQRGDELVRLADEIFKQTRSKMKRNSLRFVQLERRRLCDANYAWPGNVRQLVKAVQNAIETMKGRYLTAEMVLAAAQNNAELAS